MICSISKSLKISGSLGSLVTKPLHETDYSRVISMVTRDEAVSAENIRLEIKAPSCNKKQQHQQMLH